jgi:PPE-repeat protein
MLDFASMPPEVNSALMYTGPGPGPFLGASAAWNVLAEELFDTATAFNAVITDLTAAWLGPASIAMAAAAAPFIAWITATAGLVEAMGMQVAAATAAYEAAFAMTVPPPIIAANRALYYFLIATNFFGQNTPAIMFTEAQYMEMWAQDATAMYQYLAGAIAATTFMPFTSPPEATTAAALTAATEAAAQAAETPAGTVSQTVSSTATAPLTSVITSPLTSLLPGNLGSMLSGELSSLMSGQLSSMLSGQLSSMMSSQFSSMLTSQFTSMIPGQLTSVLSTPLTTATTNVVPGLATATMSSSSLSSWTTSSSKAFSSIGGFLGSGSGAPMSALGSFSMGSSGSFMQSFGPAAGVFGNQFHTLGYAVGNGFSSGTGLFAAPNMGSVQVAAGAGRAASVGMLSVPQSWTTAAPSQMSQLSASLPSAKVTAAPAAAAAEPPVAPGSSGMPMIPNAARGTGNAMPPPLRIGHRPNVVSEHVLGG